MTGEPVTWGHNVTAFMAHYSMWKLDSDGLRYSAQRKTERGPRGPRLTAATLDELAALIDGKGEQP